MKHVIDLTHPITASMPCYPGDTPVTLKKDNGYQLTTGMHIGTHIDGPSHMLENTLSINSFPVRYFIGPGVLIDARDKIINANLLKNLIIKPDSIVLVLTGHSKKFGTPDYFTNHPIVQQDFAQLLSTSKINMLGIDLPSPDNNPFNIHKILLQRNILIIENLVNLEYLIGISEFTITALPLKIEADSSPARVIAFY